MQEPRLEIRGPAVVAWYKGKSHRIYEDSFRLLPRAVPVVGAQNRGELFAVFDGIGGAEKGHSAAVAMADALTGFYTRPEQYENSAAGVLRLLMDANQEIHEWGNSPGTDRPLGACCGSIVHIKGEEMAVFHVGDTTAILLNGEDHIVLTKAHQSGPHQILRYFGQGEHLKIDITTVKVEPYDLVLLYSDGISKLIDAKESLDIITKFDDPGQSARALARKACQKGSPDDITVLLAEILDEEE